MKRLISIPLSLGALASPAAAEAPPLISPGIAYTAHWFDGQWDHGFAFEVSVTVITTDDILANPGAYFQMEWYGDDRTRIGGGFQVSGPLGVEIGASRRWDGSTAYNGLQIGPYASIAAAHLAGRILVEDGAGVSGGTSTYFKPLGAVGLLLAGAAAGSGRPLRAADGTLEQSEYTVLEVVGAPIDVAVGEWWLANALAEHGAIGAFIRLAGWLQQLGAPQGLVARAVAAAKEEARHAAACFAIADRLLGLRLAPIARVIEIGPAPSLVELAAANLLDGRYGEGVAAEEARRALPRATEPAVRAALTAIAVEEASHARLADDVERWAIAVGGDEVRRALQRAADRLRDAPPAMAPVPVAPAWGVPTTAMRIAARRSALAAVAPTLRRRAA